MLRTCQYCGTKNLLTRLHCKKCGKLIKEEKQQNKESHEDDSLLGPINKRQVNFSYKVMLVRLYLTICLLISLSAIAICFYFS